ncbi:unnamed protein product [Paramecium pentaurelia]|uniref:Uncharacterized protein n=1 Tax=Paramecium pentaurelia TaxID=43138 RepID=A0A8S1YIU6_9CILI|nr:unnamed protein product [Paramecium pentaurelia]
MGSSSSKKKKAKPQEDNLNKQPVQPIQAISFEFNTWEKSNQYIPGLQKKDTYNQNICNKNDLLFFQNNQQNKNLVDFNPINLNQNVYESPKFELNHHTNAYQFQQGLSFCKSEQNSIKQRIDQQKINKNLSNNGLKNMNREIQFERNQQQWNNNIPIINQRKELNLCDNQFQLYFPASNQQQLPLIQQRNDQVIKYNSLEINAITEKNIERDYIYIYILFFNKQTSETFQLIFPCKHSICNTIALMNVKGNVICKQGCASYPLDKSKFNKKTNTISHFQEIIFDDIKDYNQITSIQQMAKIFQDSLVYSNKTETEKFEFSKKFADLICKKSIRQAKQKAKQKIIGAKS